jgi:hypothetical protein
MVAHGCKDATTDHEQIAAWWRRWPLANVGLAPGNEAGFWVLDIDTDKGGAVSFQRARDRHPALEPTVVSITGGGGRHILWRTWGRRLTNHVGLLPGVDVRADGGVIVAPPSMHASGQRYRWHEDGTPGRVPLGETPNWIRVVVLAGKHSPKRRGNFSRPKPRIDVDAVPAMPDGGRNDALYRLACRLIWEERDPGEVESAIRRVNAMKCQPPKPDREVTKILNSAEKHRQ